MTIEQCRAMHCVHVSDRSRKRNCGVVDCSSAQHMYEQRTYEEEADEFEEELEE